MDQIQKWPALDVVKFIGILAMILAHAHFMLITDGYQIHDMSSFFYKITAQYMFLGLFVMMLPMIAGAVLGAVGDVGIVKMIRVAVFISLLGFAMNAATWGISYVFSWNVLQFVGLSFVVIALIMRYFSLGEVLALSLITLFAAGPLRDHFVWTNNNYFLNIFIGADNQYTFWPFFPWFSLVGLGFVYASLYKKYLSSAVFNISALIAGLSLMMIGIVRHEISPFLDPKYVWGPSLFQPKIGFVLGAIGLFCVLISLGNMLFRNASFRKYGIINSYSKGILWIYVAQMFLIFYLGIIMQVIFPTMHTFSPSYFILPVSMIFISWFIGAKSIAMLHDRSLNIVLKKRA